MPGYKRSTSGVSGAVQSSDQDLTDIGALSPSNDDLIQRKAGAWTNRTLAQIKTDLALASSNISDFNEAAQDAVGAAVTDTATIDFTYTDGSNTITADVKDASVTAAKLQSSEITRRKDLTAAVTGSFSPLVGPVSSSVQTSQQIAGLGVYLYSGETVTNVLACVQTAGTSTAPTAIYLGVWSSAATPACVAVTADLAADARWTSQGWKVNALASPYVVPSSGVYYLAFLINGTFAGTNVTLVTATAGGGYSGQIGSGVRICSGLKTGATAMAVSDTGTYGLAGNIPLMGWS